MNISGLTNAPIGWKKDPIITVAIIQIGRKIINVVINTGAFLNPNPTKVLIRHFLRENESDLIESDLIPLSSAL